MPIDRREFVRRAGQLAGVAALTGPTFLRSTTSAFAAGDSLLSLPPSESPIDTVVVLMMENRSFDHFLGWLGADDLYLGEGRRRWGARSRSRPRTTRATATRRATR